jgi:signal transduction histidine kinase
MGLVLLRVVSRGLTPVNRLAGEIGSFRESDLSRRLSSGAVPRELTPVVEKLNGLLARLEAAFIREKSFTADVSHELRTPLAGLRSILEVCRSRPRDSAAYESALDDCHAVTDHMQAMVQSLLLLARSDAGQISLDLRDVDLVQVITDAWRLFESRAEAGQVHVSLTFPPTSPACTDPDKLQIILYNLFDNALSYIDEGGHFRIALRSDCKFAVLEIVNSGSAIRAEDVPHLFDRFWRADPSRTESSVHCGLGLSICDRLTKLLGGTITIQTVETGDFSVCLTLPVEPGDSQPRHSLGL